jgi:hypothetical protein
MLRVCTFCSSPASIFSPSTPPDVLALGVDMLGQHVTKSREFIHEMYRMDGV